MLEPSTKVKMTCSIYSYSVAISHSMASLRHKCVTVFVGGQVHGEMHQGPVIL